MSLSINSQLLTFSILLAAPIAQSYAITLENGSISGKDDNYGQYRTNNNGTWVYDFGEDSQLKINDSVPILYGQIKGVGIHPQGA